MREAAQSKWTRTSHKGTFARAGAVKSCRPENEAWPNPGFTPSLRTQCGHLEEHLHNVNKSAWFSLICSWDLAHEFGCQAKCTSAQWHWGHLPAESFAVLTCKGSVDICGLVSAAILYHLRTSGGHKKWKSTNSRNLCSLTRFQNCRGYSAMVCYGYWVSWFTSHPAILDVTTESFSTLSSCEELHQSTERLKKRYRFISWGTASKLIIDMVWSDIETLVYYISICLTIYYSPKFHLIIKWQIAPAKRSSLPCYPPNLRSHPCGTSTQSKIQRIKEDPKRS